MGLIRRGEIVLVDLDPVVGSEQGKVRPALVIQNDIGNQFSPVTIVAPIISKVFKKEYPTNLFLRKEDSGLNHSSTILFNQIRTIDQSRIIKKIGKLSNEDLKRAELAIKISLGLIV